MLLLGDGATGKSALALDLAANAASDGHLVIYCSRDGGLSLRLGGWMKHHHDKPVPESLEMFAVHNEQGVSDFVWAQVREGRKVPWLVVVDGIAPSYELASALPSPVLFVSDTPGDIRPEAAAVVAKVSRVGDDRTRRVTFTKSRLDAPLHWDFDLHVVSLMPELDRSTVVAVATVAKTSDLMLTIRPSPILEMVNGTQCRVWEGENVDGTPVKVWLASVQPQTHDAARLAAFERAFEDEAAGVPRPDGGIMPDTPHARVLGLLRALVSKGAVEYGETFAQDGESETPRRRAALRKRRIAHG